MERRRELDERRMVLDADQQREWRELEARRLPGRQQERARQALERRHQRRYEDLDEEMRELEEKMQRYWEEKRGGEHEWKEDHATRWADDAYQLRGNQKDYDRVMSVSPEDREAEYYAITQELGDDPRQTRWLREREGDLPSIHELIYERQTEEARRLVLQADVDVNGRGPTGSEWERYTPLEMAVLYCPPIIQFLVEQGADLEQRDEEDFTLLHKAAYMGNMESAQIIYNLAPDQIRYRARNVYRKPDGYPANIAEQYGHEDLARWLREREIPPTSSADLEDVRNAVAGMSMRFAGTGELFKALEKSVIAELKEDCDDCVEASLDRFRAYADARGWQDDQRRDELVELAEQFAVALKQR